MGSDEITPKVFVYVAAPFDHQAEAREVRDQLNVTGLVEVRSRWLDLDGSIERSIEEQRAEAVNDLEDIHRCDVFLLLNQWSTRGGVDSTGKAVELGYAMALEKPVAMVGGPSNVFHHLVRQYPTLDEILVQLQELANESDRPEEP